MRQEFNYCLRCIKVHYRSCQSKWCFHGVPRCNDLVGPAALVEEVSELVDLATVAYMPDAPARFRRDTEVSERICRAAITCFERYGVRKTSSRTSPVKPSAQGPPFTGISRAKTRSSWRPSGARRLASSRFLRVASMTQTPLRIYLPKQP